MDFYWLVLGILATWRLTHLIQAEDGPGEILVRLRRALGHGFWGKLCDCFYCLSMWLALPLAFALAATFRERLLLWPALSAGAILLERATNRSALPALYYEDQEHDPHDLLRRPETTSGSLDERDRPQD
jgi:hypothetical protein